MPGKTITTMVTAIRTWANVDSARLPDTNALEIVNLVCRDLAGKYMSQHNLVLDSIVLPAGATSLALTSTVVLNFPHKLYWFDSTGAEVILREFPSVAELELEYPVTLADAEGPEAYCFFGRTLYFGPAPVANLTIYRYYYNEPVEFTALDASTNQYLTYEWDLVLFRALADYVSSFVVEPTRVQEWRVKADEIEDRFAAREAIRNISGSRPITEEP